MVCRSCEVGAQGSRNGVQELRGRSPGSGNEEVGGVGEQEPRGEYKIKSPSCVLPFDLPLYTHTFGNKALHAPHPADR